MPLFRTFDRRKKKWNRGVWSMCTYLRDKSVVGWLLSPIGRLNRLKGSWGGNWVFLVWLTRIDCRYKGAKPIGSAQENRFKSGKAMKKLLTGLNERKCFERTRNWRIFKFFAIQVCHAKLCYFFYQRWFVLIGIVHSSKRADLFLPFIHSYGNGMNLPVLHCVQLLRIW